MLLPFPQFDVLLRFRLEVLFLVHLHKVLVAEQGQALVTYPNPVGSALFVEVVDADNTEGVIEIYTESGSLVKTQKFTANQVRYEVDTNSLGKGNYVVKIRKADGTVSTTKISKF